MKRTVGLRTCRCDARRSVALSFVQSAGPAWISRLVLVSAKWRDSQHDRATGRQPTVLSEESISRNTFAQGRLSCAPPSRPLLLRFECAIQIYAARRLGERPPSFRFERVLPRRPLAPRATMRNPRDFPAERAEVERRDRVLDARVDRAFRDNVRLPRASLRWLEVPRAVDRRERRPRAEEVLRAPARARRERERELLPARASVRRPERRRDEVERSEDERVLRPRPSPRSRDSAVSRLTSLLKLLCCPRAVVSCTRRARFFSSNF